MKKHLFTKIGDGQVPSTTKAEQFLRIGMELEEDILLEKLAGNRYKTADKFISHKEVWGE